MKMKQRELGTLCVSLPRGNELQWNGTDQLFRAWPFSVKNVFFSIGSIVLSEVPL